MSCSVQAEGSVDAAADYRPREPRVGLSPVEQIDFEERFDDDDESVEDQGELDDTSAPAQYTGFLDTAASLTRLSQAGKQMSKIVRHLDKSNEYLWKEDKDPYAVISLSHIRACTIPARRTTKSAKARPTFSRLISLRL